MGSDVVVAYIRETPTFSRAALRTLIGDLWTGRGGVQGRARWSKAAAERCWEKDAGPLGIALSPTTPRGWIAIVESANASVRMDKEMLSLLGARTTCWVDWSCDHAGLYGSQRISKGRSKHPRDYGYALEYAELEDEPGWEFLTFESTSWPKHRDFAITERTKQHPLPPDPESDEGSTFHDALLLGDVDAALAALAALTSVTDDTLESLFSTSYRIEFDEVADCVVRVGSALSARRAMSPAHWVRLLEAASIRDDENVKAKAQEALSSFDGAQRTEAHEVIREAVLRMKTAVGSPRSAYDGRADMAPALRRFRRWTKPFG